MNVKSLQYCQFVVCYCRTAADVQFDGQSWARNWRYVKIPWRAHKESGSCRHDHLSKYHYNCMLQLQYLNWIFLTVLVVHLKPRIV